MVKKQRENEIHRFPYRLLGVLILAFFIGWAQSRAQTVSVNACAPVPGDGSASGPFNTLTRAVAVASPASALLVQGGSYPEALSISKRLTLTASGGPALIGQYYVGTQELCVPITQGEGTLGFQDGAPVNKFPDLVKCSDNPLGVHAKLYYPAAAPGDGPVACGGPFPLIIYTHGKRIYPSCDGSYLGVAQDYRQADGLLTRLAAAGMIVISVDVSPQLYDDVAKASVIVNTLTYARDETMRPGSRLQGAVDLLRVGLSGHSTGGEGALRAAAWFGGVSLTSLTLPKIQVGAVGLLAPAFEGQRATPVPTLVIHGTNESPKQVGDGPLQAYAGATPPKYLVVIAGANHFGYTDSICIAPPNDNASTVGGATGPEAQRRQQRAAGDYLEAFFSVYLRGEMAKLGYFMQQGGDQCGYPGNPPACGSPARHFSDLDFLNVVVSVCSCVL